MQYGLHISLLKISTRANNNKKRKTSLQSANLSGIKSFIYVEQDRDLNFSASSLLPFCAKITRERYVAKRECGWKTSNKK